MIHQFSLDIWFKELNVYIIVQPFLSLPAVVCGRAHVLFTLFNCVCLQIVLSNIYCVAFYVPVAPLSGRDI